MEAPTESDDTGSLPRPWEDAGNFRRDCEPERGKFLDWLGVAGVILGYGSFFIALAALPLVVVAVLRPFQDSGLDLDSESAVMSLIGGAVIAISNLLALVPSAGAWYLARRDLREIESGERDPSGKNKTHSALQVARIMSILTGIAVFIGLLACAWGALLLEVR